jgi:hypothetical protein
MTALIDLYAQFLGNQVDLVKWVAKTLGLGNAATMHPNRLRREAMAQRVRLYRDDGKQDIERMINIVFVNATVQEERRILIDFASEQNVTARIADEVASLYDRPALRRFPTPAQTAEFRDAANEVDLDEVMDEAHHLAFVCNEVLLWSVQVEKGERPELHIITPDAFDVIPHPNSRLRPAAFLVDACPMVKVDGADRRSVKQYELWDDTYVYDLNIDGEMVAVVGVENPRKHGLGRIPGFLHHRRKSVTELLDSKSGFDIVSAHLGVALLRVMVVRLAKSQGERQPILQGNLANMAAGQSMNGEKPLLLPPDVVAMMLDSKTTPDHYLSALRDKIAAVAQRYGMSYEQFTNTDTATVASGVAFQVRRQKLTELRNKQRLPARRNERGTADLMGFNGAELTVDHQEQGVPADAAAEIAQLRDETKLGLSSPIKHLMRKDPDLSREDAIEEIRENLRDYGLVVEMYRALNVPEGADASQPGQTAQQNGAMSHDGSSAPKQDSGGPLEANADYNAHAS